MTIHQMRIGIRVLIHADRHATPAARVIISAAMQQLIQAAFLENARALAARWRP